MGFLGQIVFKDIIVNEFTYVLMAFGVSIILFLALMIYYKIRINKLEKYIEYLKEQNKAVVEVSQIAKKIEENLSRPVSKPIDFEDEQEEKSIISYHELLKKEKGIDIPTRIPDNKPQVFTPSNDKAFDMYDEEEVAPKKPITKGNEQFLSNLKSLRDNLK